MSWMRPIVAAVGSGGLVAVVLAAAAAGAVCGWLLAAHRARRAARDMDALARATEALAEGGWTLGRRTLLELPAMPGGAAGAPLAAAVRRLAERAEAEIRALTKRSRNLGAIFDALDEPVMATDDADRVLLCNPSAETLLEAEPGALVGRPIREVVTHATLLEMLDEARSGRVTRQRIALTTALGQRIFQVSAAPVPAAWGGGTFGAVVLLRDVTELDLAVRVKTDFVANASHELRTPVAAIRGAAETLRDLSDGSPEMTGRLIEMVHSHAERLEEMIRDLLDLSRLESPDVKIDEAAVDLHDIARRLSQMFESACAAKKITLRYELDDELHAMRSDPKLVMLVLRNLVENAVKFGYEGTTVRIVATLVEEELPRPDGPSPERGRGVVRFEVADKGVGVPLNLQERVFERYYQVEQSRSPSVAGAEGVKRGTGLGLSIVKHAARRLGGHAGLTSVWREGTTAWVEIPVWFDGPPTPAEPASPGAPPPGGR